MKKRYIVYSLTERGLFSELSNLALACVYAKYKGMDITVNTYNWNGRIEKGLEDYFKSYLESSNLKASSQYRIITKERIWIGNIYYKPRDFYKYYERVFLNNLYLLFHPKTELSKDVFQNMRKYDFLKTVKVDDYKFFLTKILDYNADTLSYINTYCKSIGLPKDFIGVHVRRGDKITSGEMQSISLDKYVAAIRMNIKECKNVYIATDDSMAISEIKRLLSEDGCVIYSNSNVQQQGFDERSFNVKSKSDRRNDILNTLLDIYILTHSKLFIGTYSSNLSRIVPLYIGFEHCTSLDTEWFI